MLLYFFIIFFLYYIFLGLLILGWHKVITNKSDEKSASVPFISVVIAVRDEEKNISTLLKCLKEQLIPTNQFEVILVDDHSEDNTVIIVEDLMKNEDFNLRLIKSQYHDNQTISPKKSALIQAIGEAKNELIVMTDGDCRFGKNWLRSMTSGFASQKTMFVSGPVILEERSNLLSKLQTIEFASLIGSGGALIGLNYPLMCNGANLAFRKSAFYHVNGYEGNEENSSGDDVFLMQKIFKTFEDSISFAHEQDAIVETLPQSSFFKLINQRKRWVSKWNKFLMSFSWVLPIFLFIHYASFIVAAISIILWPHYYLLIGLYFTAKFILDYIFLKKVMDFCKLQFDFWIFLLSELLYPFYAMFFGVFVHFGSYSWKGRMHKINK